MNTIAPIMTENRGPAWRQTIFYLTRSPGYENPKFGHVPYLESIATWKREAGELTVLAVNRSLTEELLVEGRLSGFEPCALHEHLVLRHEDPKASNTRENPTRVAPCRSEGTKAEEGSFQSLLPPLSWNVIRLKLRS